MNPEEKQQNKSSLDSTLVQRASEEERTPSLGVHGAQRLLNVALGILAVIAVGSVWYVYNNGGFNEAMAPTVSGIVRNQIWKGDFQGAVSQLNASGEREGVLEQYARFMTALPAEQQRAAQQAEEAYRQAEGNPRLQASHLNTIIEQLLVSRSKDLEAYFFRAGGSFEGMQGENVGASAVVLAELGMSIYPTSVAQLALMLPHIDALRNEKYTDDAEARARIQAAEEMFQGAKGLYEAEVANLDAGYAQRGYMRLLTWRSSLYAAAAQLDERYLSELRANAQDALAFYDTLVKESGNENYLQSRIPPILFTYAAAMIRAQDNDSQAQAKAAADAIAKMVQADPDMHRAVFIATIQRLSKLSTKEQGYNYKGMVLLAEASEAFKVLVNEYGFSL